MSMPGFTAEASISKSISYYTARLGGYFAANGSIYPALMSLPPTGEFVTNAQSTGMQGPNNLIVCRQVCLEWSKLFPNICNTWYLDCSGFGSGPIIILPLPYRNV